MTSINFEFLKPRRPILAELGGFAEQYAYPDPQSALFKLRAFVEHMVGVIFAELRLPAPYHANLNDLLNESSFEAATPALIMTKLHAIRQRGNKAAHGAPATATTAIAMLREAHDLASWFFVRFDGGRPGTCGAFVPPSGSFATESKETLKKAQKEAHEKLAVKEAQLQKLLEQLAAERAKRSETETLAEKTKKQLDDFRLEGMKAAALLELSEANTRKNLIDSMLVDVGWDVGKGGASTEQVGQEVEVAEQPTRTGKGFADYVLWGDDGKPLAVIEAKRTTVDAVEGRTQARLYADALAKEFGYRPVIFCTNGIDVFFWDDVLGEPPRKIYGFYSKASLEYVRFQRQNRVPLDTVKPDLAIADRMYQLEAIKRVSERFTDHHRKALLVQATGTGKTRVAVSLCDVLSRAGWAKRILFLCDRRELRKQADDAFKEFLPGEPRTFINKESALDRKHRIYLATYPAMMKSYELFDVGFFDLIIADESHRSVYNYYRDLFLYFDARQIGLTATPLPKIGKSTYRLFGCEDRDPTSSFSLKDALEHIPPYLVPPRLVAHTTQFLRDGVKYATMTPDQRRQLAEDDDDPEEIHFDAEDVDRHVFNKDTTRQVLRNLMEKGIRDADGSRVGKSIIFARTKEHARHIETIFHEIYPQYGGTFLAVIVDGDSRAEQLITDFKNPKKEPVVAVSVDMLDTGIDVPQIVNLVFAKPVGSPVKLWQMLGRGTRLCKDLFGPGKDKTEFFIFDHCGNSTRFGEDFGDADDKRARSIQEQVFAARVDLAAAALDVFDRPTFERAVDLLAADLASLLAIRTIAVRDAWKEIQAVAGKNTLLGFDAVTKHVLLTVVAPLMQWIDIHGDDDAYRFDLLVARIEIAQLSKSSRFADHRDELVARVETLPRNLTQVQAKGPTILRIRDRAFWEHVTIPQLEDLRCDLRGIMELAIKPIVPRLPAKVLDVTDGGVEIAHVAIPLSELELAEYRHRVESVLKTHFDEHPTLVKIRAGVPVSGYDLEDLTKLVLELDPKVDLRDLLLHYPEAANHLEYAIRSIVGLDAVAIDAAFTGFVHAHLELNAQQLRFLALLKGHMAKYGFILVERLFHEPFTSVHTNSIDGVFPNGEHINAILDILARFAPPKLPSHPPASA